MEEQRLLSNQATLKKKNQGKEPFYLNLRHLRRTQKRAEAANRPLERMKSPQIKLCIYQKQGDDKDRLVSTYTERIDYLENFGEDGLT